MSKNDSSDKSLKSIFDDKEKCQQLLSILNQIMDEKDNNLDHYTHAAEALLHIDGDIAEYIVNTAFDNIDIEELDTDTDVTKYIYMKIDEAHQEYTQKLKNDITLQNVLENNNDITADDIEQAQRTLSIIKAHVTMMQKKGDITLTEGIGTLNTLDPTIERPQQREPSAFLKRINVFEPQEIDLIALCNVTPDDTQRGFKKLENIRDQIYKSLDLD